MPLGLYLNSNAIDMFFFFLQAYGKYMDWLRLCLLFYTHLYVQQFFAEGEVNIGEYFPRRSR